MHVVEVIGHPPHRVRDTEPPRLTLNVGVDGIAQAHVRADHDVYSVAARVIGQVVSPHTTDGLDTGIGGDDVRREESRVGDQTAHPDRGNGRPRT